MRQFHVLGICGSLRQGSYNRRLLEAARKMSPSSLEMELFGALQDIPLYNEDVEKRGDPQAVRDFKEKIEASDALLIATPEYNYSVPGVLKNALDWASRPPGRSVLNHKRCGIMGASQGNGGTMRAQLALRQSFVFTDTIALLQPELFVAKAQEKFDAEGNLIDDSVRTHLAAYMERFAKWLERPC